MTTHNEPDDQRSDGLNPARGILTALLAGALIWAVGIAAAGLALGLFR